MVLSNGRTGSSRMKKKRSDTSNMRMYHACARIVYCSRTAATTPVSRVLIQLTYAHDIAHYGLDADFGKQVYSNGLSEVILGKAIKKLGLPREELVIMTKVRVRRLIVFQKTHA